MRGSWLAHVSDDPKLTEGVVLTLRLRRLGKDEEALSIARQLRERAHELAVQ